MVQPTTHGYPDWQRQVAVADTVVADQETVAVSGTVTVGRFYVGAYPALSLELLNLVGQNRTDLIFYSEETGGAIMGLDSFRTRLSAIFNGRITVKGPWLQVEFEAEDAGSNSIQWSASLVNRHGLDQVNPIDNAIIRQASAAVGAGATQTDTANRIWPGAVTVNYSTDAAAYRFVIQAFNSAGGWDTIARIDNTADPCPFLVYLPTTLVRTQFTNDDGATRSVRVFINGQLGLAT